MTHLYRYAISSGLLRQALPRELASGASRDVLSLATSGGVTEAGPAVHPYFFAEDAGLGGTGAGTAR